MAQQINLYNPALRLQREWLTLGNVLAAAVCFALALGGVGAYLRSQADARAQAAQGALEAGQDRGVIIDAQDAIVHGPPPLAARAIQASRSPATPTWAR